MSPLEQDTSGHQMHTIHTNGGEHSLGFCCCEKKLCRTSPKPIPQIEEMIRNSCHESCQHTHLTHTTAF